MMDMIVFVLGIVGLCGILLLSAALLGSALEAAGYERGQIDALNGKVKYELVEQPNGEKLWQKIQQQEQP